MSSLPECPWQDRLRSSHILHKREWEEVEIEKLEAPEQNRRRVAEFFRSEHVPDNCKLHGIILASLLYETTTEIGKFFLEGWLPIKRAYCIRGIALDTEGNVFLWFSNLCEDKFATDAMFAINTGDIERFIPAIFELSGSEGITIEVIQRCLDELCARQSESQGAKFEVFERVKRRFPEVVRLSCTLLEGIKSIVIYSSVLNKPVLRVELADIPEDHQLRYWVRIVGTLEIMHSIYLHEANVIAGEDQQLEQRVRAFYRNTGIEFITKGIFVMMDYPKFISATVRFLNRIGIGNKAQQRSEVEGSISFGILGCMKYIRECIFNIFCKDLNEEEVGLKRENVQRDFAKGYSYISGRKCELDIFDLLDEFITSS